MAAIDLLTAEHRVIEQMLDVLERLAMGRDAGGEFPVRLLTDLADLLEQYVDVIHHTKEERRLFEIVLERGLEAEGGSVSALIHHHETGRAQLREMRAELDRVRQGDRTAAAAAALAARAYAEFLRGHIRLEDEGVYPLVAKAMSAEEDHALALYFRKVDEDGGTVHLLARFEELRTLALETTVRRQ